MKLEITDTGKKKIFSYPLDSVFINPEYIPEEKLAIQPNKFLEQYKYIDDTLTVYFNLDELKLVLSDKV